MARGPKKPLSVETLTHEEAQRRNIPTAELESVMRTEDKSPIRVAYDRRNRDLDPQLVWRGKDEQDWSDLVVQAPPLYIQEKVHPKVLIDDLMRRSRARTQADAPAEDQFDMFADFNGLPDTEAKTEFYEHDQNWSNRMILGDSLQVMASLAEREGLRGKVQCIYIDPPYGIKFNSNFQWSTTSRDVKDGKADHITREPEQVKAFRDTWRDGIHSYLTYLRDRLTVARDLLADSGSVFVQIGDENVHRVRALMDEVFGEGNFICLITALKTTSATSQYLAGVADYVLFFSKNRERLKYRSIYALKELGSDGTTQYKMISYKKTGITEIIKSPNLVSFQKKEDYYVFAPDNLTSQKPPGDFPFTESGKIFGPGKGFWKTHDHGFRRLSQATRLHPIGNTLMYRRYLDDFSVYPISNIWRDVLMTGFSEEKFYVVQSSSKIVERCMLMASDPGDLVLDPTCGSGTTATVAEQWGRRWITIDTSRVALALARARIMGARYPYYLLADSIEGQAKEAEVSRRAPSETSTRADIRQGFVYERVPHITLKSIANNAEIDVIWDRLQPAVEAARADLNAALAGHGERFPVSTGGRAGKSIDFTASGTVTLPSGEDAPANGFMEWEVPREPGTPWPEKHRKLWDTARLDVTDAPPAKRKAAAQALAQLNTLRNTDVTAESLPPRPVTPWPDTANAALEAFWQARIARQKEIDASIAAKADVEYLYDKPYSDTHRVRVAGPFTVESLSPHRVLAVDQDDELVDMLDAAEGRRHPGERTGGEHTADANDFTTVVLDHLRTSGVQQAHKEDKITFSTLSGWPGEFIGAEGRFMEGDTEKRAGVFIGPEFGTVSRPDLVAAAREAGDAGFDVLIACAFNYDAHAGEFEKLGRIPVLKARMNADLHMADDLKNTGKGNLFVIFGEPDIDIEDIDDGRIQVRINGVDVFHPQTGQIDSSGPEGIACWFIDTAYNEESFFVRHAYFLGASDPYKALKTTLKAEIDEEAWASLNRAVSRPFDKPTTGRIAVKVINHLGDEVMKVFSVG
ncbi:site-specific DNA-methyltransferase [Roseospira marina]|uniref:site-specific DNA-methyltransferase (adenine-specific) n=1 Tax=Roseospira marina TaxID=140057 RepID=A0A5M6I6T9_9PROT|nr:DNA methyltransferase [Roseospira marina]KAA5603971.1 site-specific DNA-methyltransferase [Roseospira marina]MBB4315943.1 adenine-specific DNA-methyltransferase [Roseospira marina]MBB5089096.1 adenine-specific DNA-methyltransferase [Roseospira marina]